MASKLVRHITAAAYSQIAAFYGLPENALRIVEQYARNGDSNKIIFFLQDETISKGSTVANRTRCNTILLKLKELKTGMENPDDVNTLIANFEAITSKQFVRPEWLSTISDDD